jgi:hypothetical protein
VNPNDPNVVLLEHVAQRLDAALRDELVFVGGAVAGLLITDPAHPAIRPTRDVDLIVRVVTRHDYYGVEQRLSALGFTRDLSAEAPICRWRIDGTVIVDVMPTLDEILGFANRWYPLALDTALSVRLPSGTLIRLIAPPAFLATKLEAFEGRGGGCRVARLPCGALADTVGHAVLHRGAGVGGVTQCLFGTLKAADSPCHPS